MVRNCNKVKDEVIFFIKLNISDFLIAQRFYVYEIPYKSDVDQRARLYWLLGPLLIAITKTNMYRQFPLRLPHTGVNSNWLDIICPP